MNCKLGIDSTIRPYFRVYRDKADKDYLLDSDFPYLHSQFLTYPASDIPITKE